MQNAQTRIEDLVELFVETGNVKRGKWLSNTSIVSIDCPAETAPVPGNGSREIKAAFENIRPTVPEDNFASSVQESLKFLE